jgi:DNA invertase Pin-like site-specific DNA recombinase
MGNRRIAEEQPPTINNPGWPLAGGYYRKSQVFGEEDRVSTQRQRDAITREGERTGHNIEWWCDEEGHRSGRHDHTRPGYMQFKRRLISGAYRTVLFYRLDRANRSIKETIWLVEHCQKAGVRLIIIRDGFDSARDGWQARAIRRLYHDAVDNQGEADDAADRMRDAIRHAKSKGIPWGTTPKGYLRVGVGSHAKWVKRDHHEPHAKRQHDNSAGDVRTWLTLFATKSYQATAHEANKRGMKWYDREGLPTPLTSDRIRQIAGNLLTYCGYLMPAGGHAKARLVKLDGTGTLLDQFARAYDATRTDHIEPILDPITDQPLIERIIAKRRQAQGALDERGRRAKKRVGILTPALFWRRDDGRLIKLRSHDNNGTHYYITRTRPQMSWHAHEVEEMLLEQLRGVAFPPAALGRIRQIVAEQHGDAKRAEAQAAVTRARNRLVAIDEMRLELKARRAGGEIDANRYAEDDARYRQMQHDAELQLFQAQRVLNSAGDIDQVIGLLTDLGRSIDRLTPELKRKALQGLFAKKIINAGGEVIRLEPQVWIAQAFGELVWAWRHAHPAHQDQEENDAINDDIPKVTPTGLDAGIGISPQTAWLLERIAA